MKKLVATTLTLAVFLGGISVASAQTSQSAVDQVKTLLETIKSLQAQLDTLNKQKGQVQSELQASLRLTRSLTLGMSGDEVKALQEFLATDSEVYPEGLTTGFFGALTEKAVKRFQKKHGIEQVGNVGPKTLAKINSLGLPKGLAKKFGDIGSTTASTTASTTWKGFGDHKVTICHKGQTLSVALPALPAHLGHGDKAGACGTTTTQPPTSTTTVDTTAPTISNIGVSEISSTTATIAWATNEASTGKVWYSNVNPVSTSTATSLTHSSLSTSHSFNLTGLNASTTYYYLVGSSDLAGNAATSSQGSFTTQ